jgi:hypothetical protein
MSDRDHPADPATRLADGACHGDDARDDLRGRRIREKAVIPLHPSANRERWTSA